MDPTPACGLAGVTCFAFDAAGNLADLTDANGNVTSFDDDERERVTDRTDPLLNAETFSYDGDGNLRFATDRKGQMIELQYDVVDRLIKKIMQPGEPEEVVRNISYDLVDNVTSIMDSDSSLAFTYDLLSRLETASTVGAPVQPGVVLTATYDANNNRVSLDDPIGQSTFTYDALNRLTDLVTPSLPAQPILYTYDTLSRRTGVSLPNGVDTSLTFDTAGRLTDISHVLGGITSVSSFAYGHDNVNNRTSLTQTRPVSVQTTLAYVYDDLDRLTQATNPEVAAPDETFGYDPVGNRLNRDGQVVDSTFDGADRLIEDEQFCYVYDVNGNLSSKTAKVASACTGGITSYTWDAEDRLERIDLPGGGFAEYRYDGLGRRIEKDVSGTITRYIYDGSAILLEYDGSNVLLTRYTHGPEIDDPVMIERDLDASGTFELTEIFFYHTDGLGSVTDLIDSTGAVARSLVYDSYGGITQDTGGVAQPFAYTGRELDAESGLYFYRARYYDPATGRFLSQDPIGFAAGDENLYRYVFNSPVNLIDPDGRFTLEIDASGTGVVGKQGAQKGGGMVLDLATGEGGVTGTESTEVVGAMGALDLTLKVKPFSDLGDLESSTTTYMGSFGEFGGGLILDAETGGFVGVELSVGAGLGAAAITSQTRVPPEGQFNLYDLLGDALQNICPF